MLIIQALTEKVEKMELDMDTKDKVYMMSKVKKHFVALTAW